MIVYDCGAKLRELRKLKHLSLLDVSKETKMAKSNLSSIELNKRNVDHEILLDIMVNGLDYRPTHAKRIIRIWVEKSALLIK